MDEALDPGAFFEPAEEFLHAMGSFCWMPER
jgi:hypothetical protein